MQQWEYRVEYIAHSGHDGEPTWEDHFKMIWQRELEQQLNEFGAEGWDIVSFPTSILDNYADGFIVLKRPIDRKKGACQKE